MDRPMLDAICCSADVGRINPILREFKIVIICPEMIFNGKLIKTATMTKEQCIVRIKQGADCTLKCVVAKKLTEKVSPV